MLSKHRQFNGHRVVFALVVWIVGWHLDSKISEARWEAEYASRIAQDAQYAAEKAQDEAETASRQIESICWQIEC